LVERLGRAAGKRVVLVDTREELCVYLLGHPHTRRDIELPTAQLHHAGIHWRELQRLEGWLLEDVRLSSANWAEEMSHRVLVHKEAAVCGCSPPYPQRMHVVHCAEQLGAAPCRSSGVLCNACSTCVISGRACRCRMRRGSSWGWQVWRRMTRWT
jgi:hypothetical protein